MDMYNLMYRVHSACSGNTMVNSGHINNYAYVCTQVAGLFDKINRTCSYQAIE